MAARRIIVVASLIAACNAAPNPSQTGSGTRSAQATTTCGSSTPRNPNVLVIADDPNNAAVGTLASLLASAGNNVTTTAASGLQEWQWTGDAPYTLGSYDVVVHMDRTWSTPLSEASQSLLTSYVQAGGGFVAFQYDGYEKDANDYANIAPLLPMGYDWSGNYQCMDCDVQASVVAAQASHPILAGVSSTFTFHADTWVAPTDAIDPTAYPNAVVLVGSLPSPPPFGWDPEPLVIADQVGSGRVVNFAIAPGDNDVNSLANAPSADLNKLLTNAVAWAANLQPTQVDAPVAVAGADQTKSCVAATDQVSVTLDGSASSGTAPLTYKWTDQNGAVVSTDPKPTLTLGAGNYTFSLVVSSGGCDSDPSVTHVYVVSDTTPPSISINGGDTATVECGTAWVHPDAVPSDVCSASITQVVDQVNTSKVGGPYAVTYTAQDSAGNTSSATLQVTVVDTRPPMLTLSTNTLPPVECGTTFTPPAIATATDMCYGTNVLLSTINGVNTSAPGSYTVTYVATDPSPNHNSMQKNASVQVVDTTKPVISVVGSKNVSVECGDSYTDQGATVSDSCDKGVTLSTINPVNATVPAPYVVTYSATDASQNSASDSRSVVVSDTLPPVLTLNGPSSMTLQCGVDSYVEPGASAVDKCSGVVAPTSSGTVNSSKVGQYVVSYAATDSVGHTAAATRSVSVVDTFPPNITVKPMLQFASPPQGSMKTFNLSDCASVADKCDGAMNIDQAASIVSIYSDEKGNADNEVQFLGPSSFSLRLDRDPKGNGHVYGVTFRVNDSRGNVSTGLCKIGITSDGLTAAIDDGPSAGYVYTPTMQRVADPAKEHKTGKPEKKPKKLAGQFFDDDF